MVDLFDLETREQKRETYFIGFIGHNRTGKTTYMRENIKEYKKKYPHNKVIAYDPQNKLADLIHEKVVDEKDLYDIVNDNRDILLILDDYDSLIKGNQVLGAFKNLLQLRSDYGIDIFFATHAPQFIKQGMTPFITHLYAFFCNLPDKIIGMDSKVPNGELMEFIFRDVAKEVKLKGRGTFEKKNFKHIIFCNDSATFQRVNFETNIKDRINVAS